MPVLSAFHPFDFLGVSWAVLSEQDIKEIEAPTREMRDTAIQVAIVVCLGVGILGALIAYSMTSPLFQLSAAFQRFGKTRKPGDIPHVDAQDEIGDLARAFDGVTNDIGTYIREREKAEEKLSSNVSFGDDSVDSSSIPTRGQDRPFALQVLHRSVEGRIRILWPGRSAAIA